MSHRSQICLVSEVVRRNQPALTDAQLLEVGALDVSGNIRALFETHHFLGIDLTGGPNVDCVTRVETLRSEGCSFPDER